MPCEHYNQPSHSHPDREKISLMQSLVTRHFRVYCHFVIRFLAVDMTNNRLYVAFVADKYSLKE